MMLKDGETFVFGMKWHESTSDKEVGVKGEGATQEEAAQKMCEAYLNYDG